MALVKKYKAKVVSVVKHSGDLFTVEFIPMENKFKYHPGQFLHLALDTEYDGIGQWPESRCFSMQTSPSSTSLKITYSVKGRFTKMMADNLQPGSQVWLKLPYGELFSQPHRKINTVFIGGGTGITPFLSLFTHTSFDDYINPRIYLGFQTKKHNIYQDEIVQLGLKYLKVFYEDEEGIIDVDKIFAENGDKGDYFISGPPAMIKFFKQRLTDMGISENQILADDWE